jgi:hypothetical protein
MVRLQTGGVHAVDASDYAKPSIHHSNAGEWCHHAGKSPHLQVQSKHCRIRITSLSSLSKGNNKQQLSNF